MDLYVFNIFSLVYLISAFIALVVIALLLKRWQLAEARYVIFFQIAAFIWSFTEVFEVSATTVFLKQVWSQISYLGITSAPVLFLLLALSYSKCTKFLSTRAHIALFILPAITLVVAATNPLHGWLWPEIIINTENNIAFYGHGTWFWINIAYSYLALATGMVFLLYSIVSMPGHYKSQVLALIVATALPFLGNAMYVFKLNPIPGLDLTPIALILTGLILSFAIFKYKVFDLVPIARHTLVENMSDGLLVVDEHDRVIDINNTMKEIINKEYQNYIGLSLSTILSEQPNLFDLISDKGNHEYCTGERCYDINTTRILPGPVGNPGKLIVFRDITDRKTIEKEREKLILDLQAALQEVNKLSGLLPICSSCKKIRDDGGYWHEVESYVMQRTSAQFSHGICPDCRQKLYPEYPKEEKGAPE